MTNASKQRPENRYKTIHVSELAGFPAPGERQYINGAYKGRAIGFIPYGKELLGRDFLVNHENQPLEIPADQRIMGVLSRETPSATMASVFTKFLDWAHNLADISRDPNAAPQNLMFVLSGPGVGKTHLPKVISKAFGYSHELIGSGEAGGDIDELVIAHEFKGNSAGDIFKKVEAVLSATEDSATKQQLIAKLQSANFAEEYLTEDGSKAYRLKLDTVMQTPAEGSIRTSAQEQQMDQNIQKVYGIAKECHLDVKDQDSGIGIQKVNGRLLTKLLQMKEQYERSGKAEPVIITLDEFNRFRSFGKKLQNFWEVIGGASKEPVTLVDAAGISHVFTPDMLRHVFVYMTGNDPKKVPGARELDYSMLDRIGENRVFRLNDFSVADWQHRLEQQLMGIGIDMHYRAGQAADGNFWDKNPDKFTEHLLAKRGQGLTPAEKLQFGPMQTEMLGNWDKIHKGTGQVGEFFTDWVKIYQDPKYKGELLKMPSVPEISPRLMIHILNELRSATAGSATLAENMLAMQTGKPFVPAKLSSINLGTKLCAKLKGLIDKTHPEGDSVIRRTLYLSMYKNGIVSKEQMIKAGYDDNEMHQTTPTELVENLLNTDPNRHYDKELKPLQAAVAEVIRQRYPDQREKSDDELITLKELTESINVAKKREEDMERTGRPSDMPKVFRRVLVPNISLADGQTRIEFQPGTVVDSYMLPEQIKAGQRDQLLKSVQANSEKPDTLATTSETLLGLALANNTAQQIQEMVNSESSKAFGAILAESQLNVRTKAAANAKDDAKAAAAALLAQAQKKRDAARAQLDPDFTGKVERHELTSGADQLMDNTHPSGLSVSALHTVGYDESKPADQAYFSDTLSIITLTQPDPDTQGAMRSDVLVVGFSPIPDGLKTYLHDKRHITYVCAKEEGAQETITSTLKSLVGAAKAQLTGKEANHPDLNETSSSGLVWRLEQALDVRTSDARDSRRLTPKREEGQPVPELHDLRVSALAAHLMDDRNLTSSHNRLQHVTRLSWQEMVAGQGKTESSGRAA